MVTAGEGVVTAGEGVVTADEGMVTADEGVVTAGEVTETAAATEPPSESHSEPRSLAPFLQTLPSNDYATEGALLSPAFL